MWHGQGLTEVQREQQNSEGGERGIFFCRFGGFHDGVFVTVFLRFCFWILFLDLTIFLLVASVFRSLF